MSALCSSWAICCRYSRLGRVLNCSTISFTRCLLDADLSFLPELLVRSCPTEFDSKILRDSSDSCFWNNSHTFQVLGLLPTNMFHVRLKLLTLFVVKTPPLRIESYWFQDSMLYNGWRLVPFPDPALVFHGFSPFYLLKVT